jgi:predicted nucleotidyltransferase
MCEEDHDGLRNKSVGKRIADVAQQFDLEFVVLFGSRAKGRAVDRSDIDLAVMSARRGEHEKQGPEQDERHFSIIADLESALAGTFGEVDVTFVNGAGPLIQYAIAKSGIPLFEHRPGTFIQFQSLAARRYEDSLKYFRAQSEYLQRKYGRGTG